MEDVIDNESCDEDVDENEKGWDDENMTDNEDYHGKYDFIMNM